MVAHVSTSLVLMNVSTVLLELPSQTVKIKLTSARSIMSNVLMVASQKTALVNVHVNVFLDGKVLSVKSTLTIVLPIHASMVANVLIKLMVTNANVLLEHLGHDVSANHVPVPQIHVNLEAVFLVQVQATDSSVDVTKDGTVNIVIFLLVTTPCVKMVVRPCQTSSHIPMTHHVDANVLKGSPDDTVRTLLFAMLLIHVKMVENVTLLMARPLDVSVKMVLSGNFASDNRILAKTIHV